VVERRRQWTLEEKSVLISVREADAVGDPSPNPDTGKKHEPQYHKYRQQVIVENVIHILLGICSIKVTPVRTEQ
jgi:hypothetical protein